MDYKEEKRSKTNVRKINLAVRWDEMGNGEHNGREGELGDGCKSTGVIKM